MNAGLHFLPWEITRAQGMMVCLKRFLFVFFYEIHNYLLESLNYSFIHGQLSHSQCQAMITLIEKKGIDKRFFEKLEAHFTD